jgi:ribosome-binding protein aMBF1 (putative translation factor)
MPKRKNESPTSFKTRLEARKRAAGIASDYIKKCLEKTGMSTSELALELGISSQRLSDVKNCRTRLQNGVEMYDVVPLSLLYEIRLITKVPFEEKL